MDHGGMLAVVLLLSASVASAYHPWGNYHWARESNPFTLKLVDSVTSNWDSHLGVASTNWTASNVLNTYIEDGNDKRGTRKRCAAISGKDRVCNAEYGYNGWLGVATIWISGSHIVAGTAKLNDSYFYPKRGNSKYGTAAWRQYVMCQEVGHTFGLDHQDTNFYNTNLGSCMDYTADPDGSPGSPSNERPNLHDYDQLENIYTPTDGTTTVASATEFPAPQTGAHSGDDDDWGKPTGKKDGKGRDILFEKDLGGGKKKFTWVFWAETGNPDKGKP